MYFFKIHHAWNFILLFYLYNHLWILTYDNSKKPEFLYLHNLNMLFMSYIHHICCCCFFTAKFHFFYTKVKKKHGKRAHTNHKFGIFISCQYNLKRWVWQKQWIIEIKLLPVRRMRELLSFGHSNLQLYCLFTFFFINFNFVISAIYRENPYQILYWCIVFIWTKGMIYFF